MPIIPGLAGTRYDRIGTVFSRVSGLIRSGTISGLSIPIWYPIYQAFPPKFEPRFDRPPPKIRVSKLVYQEDQDRAKLHQLKQIRPFDLTMSGPLDEAYYFAKPEPATGGKERISKPWT